VEDLLGNKLKFYILVIVGQVDMDGKEQFMNV
jgi:hypothetical protein